MSIQKKQVRGGNEKLKQLRSGYSASDGSTFTETQNYVGSYEDCLTKFKAVMRTAKGASISPTEAGEAQVTVTNEAEIENTTPSDPVIEVLWVELRKSVMENPAFANVPENVKKQIRDSAEKASDSSTPVQPPDFGSAPATKLWKLLASGTTEYSTGVPVVRRTTTRQSRIATPGGAWFRENPPVSVPGSWEWMKTVNELRKEGKTRTLTEEWTAATKWDHTLYPL